MVHAAKRKPSFLEALFGGPAKHLRVRRPADKGSKAPAQAASDAETKAKAKAGNSAKGRVGSASRMTLG